MTDSSNDFSRHDGRAVDALRSVTFRPNPAPASAGSVLIEMGNTHVICAASIEDGVPRWFRSQDKTGGWVTAEYSMLPYSTGDRSRRESAAGKISGRTSEIQRLIGRSLRAVVDLRKLGPRTIWVDCDVLQADGGTRTASITGAYVALKLAIRQLVDEVRIEDDPVLEPLAAISVGVVDGVPVLDLDYKEDVAAEVDLNVVMTKSGKLVEVQGTAEEEPFSRETFNQMLDLAEKGIAELNTLQAEALKF